MSRTGRYFQPTRDTESGWERGVNLIKDPKDLDPDELQDGLNAITEPGYARPRGAQSFLSTERFPKRAFKDVINFIDDDGVDNILLAAANEIIFRKHRADRPWEPQRVAARESSPRFRWIPAWRRLRP